MRNVFIAFGLVVATVAQSAAIDPAVSQGTTPRRHQFFGAAQRLIHLADGSNLLIYQPDLPNERPPRMDVYIVAAGDDPDKDRSFRLEMLIPNEIEDGYPGQVRSAAMSSDHRWLAVVGGWFGKHDKRGHNGLFVLHSDVRGFWSLKSWFDVPDMALGDVAFGPDDLLLVTSRPHFPKSSDIPTVTLFTAGGQNLGSFVPSSNHVSALGMRLVRTDERAYALYDPETAQVRYLSLTTKPAVVQERTAPVPFATPRVNLVAFDPRADGRVVYARTIVEDHHAKTIVTVAAPDGSVAEEWIAPQPWQIGYADEKGVIHGYSRVPAANMSITSLAVR